MQGPTNSGCCISSSSIAEWSESLQKLSTRSHRYYRPLTCEPHIRAGLHPTVAPIARSCTTKDTPGELQSLRTHTAGASASDRHQQGAHCVRTHTHTNSVPKCLSRSKPEADTSTCNGQVRCWPPIHTPKSGKRHSRARTQHVSVTRQQWQHKAATPPCPCCAQGTNDCAHILLLTSAHDLRQR